MKTEKEKITLYGFALMILGITSFSNHPVIGDIITLTGCVIVIYTCFLARFRAMKNSSHGV